MVGKSSKVINKKIQVVSSVESCQPELLNQIEAVRQRILVEVLFKAFLRGFDGVPEVAVTQC